MHINNSNCASFYVLFVWSNLFSNLNYSRFLILKKDIWLNRLKLSMWLLLIQIKEHIQFLRKESHMYCLGMYASHLSWIPLPCLPPVLHPSSPTHFLRTKAECFEAERSRKFGRAKMLRKFKSEKKFVRKKAEAKEWKISRTKV